MLPISIRCNFQGQPFSLRKGKSHPSGDGDPSPARDRLNFYRYCRRKLNNPIFQVSIWETSLSASPPMQRHNPLIHYGFEKGPEKAISPVQPHPRGVRIPSLRRSFEYGLVEWYIDISPFSKTRALTFNKESPCHLSQ